MPVVYRLVPSETVVGNVVWEQVEEPLAVEVVVVLDVVLLRRYHGQVFLLLTPDCIVIYFCSLIHLMKQDNKAYMIITTDLYSPNFTPLTFC